MVILLALASAGAAAGQPLPWLDRRWMDRAVRREALVAASVTSFDAPQVPHLRVLAPRPRPLHGLVSGPSGL